jgi:hypothetical protein
LGYIGYWLYSNKRFDDILKNELKRNGILPRGYHLINSMVYSSVVCDAALFHPFFWNDWKKDNFLEVIQEMWTKEDFKSQPEVSQTSREDITALVSSVSVYGLVL